MVVIFSHILAFSALFVAGIFDWKTTEVPDIINVVGVAGGILIHLYASIPYMDFSTLFSIDLILFNPVQWILALGDPFLWSIGIGLVLSVYGWGLYFLGMWGGADAFAMSVLGFAAPYSLQGFGLEYPVSIFIAVTFLGFVYTLLFGISIALRNREVFGKTWRRLKENERRVGIEIVIASVISAITALNSFKLALIYYTVFLSLIFLLRFFRIVQEDLMMEEVGVDDLKGGEVLAREEDLGGKIEGLTEEDIQDIEQESVKIRRGIKFVPVFPFAIFIVDVLGFKISWLIAFFSLL